MEVTEDDGDDDWLRYDAMPSDRLRCQHAVFQGLYHARLDLISGVDEAPGRPGGPRPDVSEILIEAGAESIASWAMLKGPFGRTLAAVPH